MEELSPPLQDLFRRFRDGQRLGLARAISVVENERDGFQGLLHAVIADGLEAQRIGITGPPGAGKSSLVAALCQWYRDREEEVGVVAVDPSSPYSGGALLGDRIRMNDLATDPGIFIRSMATRGSLGGLATTTKEVVDLMDGFGFPRVIIETVGVGQTELEVTSAADTVVVVLVPESGDGVQAMKAGLMEIADIFVVNKADRPGADRLLKELRMAIHLRSDDAGGSRSDMPAHHGVDMAKAVRERDGEKTARRWEKPEGWQIPVLATSAQSGEGVPALAEAIAAHREHLLETGEIHERRRKRAEIRVRDVVARELRRQAWETVSGEALQDGLDGITEGRETPYSVAGGFVRRILGGGAVGNGAASLAAALAVLTGLLALALGAAPVQAQQEFVLDTLQVSVESRVTEGVGAVQVISAATLRALPVRSVEEALQWATGVDLQPRSGAQADVSIRGSSFEQILVLVDGTRMSDPQSGHFDLDLAVPLDRVERVEILRGPASAMYGADAFGGVINIITKDGRDGPRSLARVEGGSNGTWALAADSQDEIGNWTLGAGISRDQSDGHRDGTDYTVTRMTARTAGPAGDGRAFLDVGYAMRDFGAADFYGAFPSYEETRTVTASGRWVGRVSDRLTLEPRVSYRGHEDDFILRREDPSFYRNLHDSWRAAAELEGRLRVGPRGAFSFGGEWARESLESTNLGDREQDWRAAFAELVWRVDAVQLQGGIRWDDRDDVGEFFSPSASLRWQASPVLALRGSWGRTFRAPTWTERFYEDPANIGTPDLAVERGWSGELAAEVALQEVFLTATIFRRNAENLIDWARPEAADPATTPWRTRNVNEAIYDGLELTGQHALGDLVTLQASASWLTQDASAEDGFLSKYALRPIHREFVARVLVPLADGSVLTLSGADRSRIGGGGGFTTDVRLSIPVEEAQLYLDALNLTDADYADVTGFPIPGRRFLVGLRTTF